jgi:hypothetical protein
MLRVFATFALVRALPVNALSQPTRVGVLAFAWLGLNSAYGVQSGCQLSVLTTKDVMVVVSDLRRPLGPIA